MHQKREVEPDVLKYLTGNVVEFIPLFQGVPNVVFKKTAGDIDMFYLSDEKGLTEDDPLYQLCTLLCDNNTIWSYMYSIGFDKSELYRIVEYGDVRKVFAIVELLPSEKLRKKLHLEHDELRVPVPCCIDKGKWTYVYNRETGGLFEPEEVVFYTQDMKYVKEVRYGIGLHDGMEQDKYELEHADYTDIYFDEIKDWLDSE